MKMTPIPSSHYDELLAYHHPSSSTSPSPPPKDEISRHSMPYKEGSCIIGLLLQYFPRSFAFISNAALRSIVPWTSQCLLKEGKRRRGCSHFSFRVRLGVHEDTYRRLAYYRLFRLSMYGTSLPFCGVGESMECHNACLDISSPCWAKQHRISKIAVLLIHLIRTCPIFRFAAISPASDQLPVNASFWRNRPV
jgi:hypothetical protein